jgi:hypothetical protein
MSSIFEILEMENGKKQAGFFGIEIEVEGKHLGINPARFWRAEADGSLRNGIEYVLKKPLFIKEVSTALQYLNNYLKDQGSRPVFSFRTSVHVHLNVQSLTEDQLLNLIYTYSLLENVFMEYCGDSRKGNRFCLRAQDADGYVDNVDKLFSQGVREIFRIPQNQIRYSSLNLEALLKYGSIEFRGLAGTLDEKRILVWCQAIDKLREYAVKQENPIAIMNHFRESHSISFAKEILGELFQEFEFKGMDKELVRNFSLAIDFPSSYRDRKEKKEVAKAKKEIDPIRQQNVLNEVLVDLANREAARIRRDAAGRFAPWHQAVPNEHELRAAGVEVAGHVHDAVRFNPFAIPEAVIRDEVAVADHNNRLRGVMDEQIRAHRVGVRRVPVPPNRMFDEPQEEPLE